MPPSINLGVGNTCAGVITQIVATGSMDKFLTENAVKTYWKAKYERTTCFSMEFVTQPFTSQVAFGQTSQVTLNRTGDLIYHMYVLIHLPGIVAEEPQSNSTMRSQFPVGDNSTIYKADCNVYADYCNEKEVAVEAIESANSGDSHSAKTVLEKGKARWLAESYASGYDASWQPEEEELPETWACWSNSIGHLAIKCASLVIGGSTIDTLYSDFLFMWEELSGKSGKRLSELIGKHANRQELICASQRARILHVPLPFFFTQHPSQALSLASLQFHGVQLVVEFERLENCIQVSRSDLAVTNCSTGNPITSTDINAAVDTTYIYLSTEERQKFSSMQFEQLITQVQQYTMTSTASNLRFALSFNHPIIELLVGVRRACNEKTNNWFNYTGIDGLDPVKNISLLFNNQTRFNNVTPEIMRIRTPYECHSNIPDFVGIYVLSFALHPESIQPSGTANFSRIDHVDMQINLQDGLGKEQVTVMVFAKSYNLLRYRQGLAGLGFAN